MKSIFAVAILMLVGNVHASDLLTRAELSPEVFPAASERLRTLLMPGQVHGDLAATQKTLVLQRLRRIQTQLDQPERTERRQQLALERHLKSVNDILATGRTAANSEVVCRRQKTTGSNRVEVICYDRAEVDAKTEETRDSFFKPDQCLGNICTSGSTLPGAVGNSMQGRASYDFD